MDLTAARSLAIEWMEFHGLATWRFAFDDAKARAGLCRYGPKTISLSRRLTALHSEAEVRDTILHEIAHASVGPGHHHDALWRATAIRIGCSGGRCVPENAPRVEGAWIGTCPSGHRRTAHKRPERVKSCSECSPGVFSTNAILDWTYRGRPAPMHPNFVAELANIRARAAGEAVAPLRLVPGQRVVVHGDHQLSGQAAVIRQRARTRYLVELADGTQLRVPFGMVAALRD